MKQIIALSLAASLLAAPAMAQDKPEDESGFNLMEEGARMIMRGLMSEMEPAMDSLREQFDALGPRLSEFAATIGPAFVDLLEQVDDMRNYQAPEFLPNGDIIIRRKPDAPVWSPQDAPTDL